MKRVQRGRSAASTFQPQRTPGGIMTNHKSIAKKAPTRCGASFRISQLRSYSCREPHKETYNLEVKQRSQITVWHLRTHYRRFRPTAEQKRRIPNTERGMRWENPSAYSEPLLRRDGGASTLAVQTVSRAPIPNCAFQIPNCSRAVFPRAPTPVPAYIRQAQTFRRRTNSRTYNASPAHRRDSAGITPACDGGGHGSICIKSIPPESQRIQTGCCTKPF